MARKKQPKKSKKTFVPKPIKNWALLLIVPISTLVVLISLQFLLLFIFSKSVHSPIWKNHALGVSLNVFFMALGGISAVLVLLAPLWLVYIIRDLPGHPRRKNVAIALAVAFGFFSWVYTWDKNRKKFWINLALGVVSLGYWTPIAWLWAIIDNSSKPDSWYAQYHEEEIARLQAKPAA